MIKSRVVVAGALLAAAGAASAGSFSVTPAVTNDYDWRGLTQSDEDFAFQLGGSYEADNGFYVGAWGSQVDFGPGDPNVEIDVFAGYAAETDMFGYDLGVNYYTYPGDSDGNFFEVYAGISKGMFSGKLWFSPKFLGDYGDDPGFYIEGNVEVPLPSNFSLLGHVGYSFGDVYTGSSEYTDFAVGVGYSFSNFDLSAKYVDGSDGLDGRFVALLSTTLPWSN